VQRDNIILNGAGYTLQGTYPIKSKSKGIDLTERSNVTIKNLKITAFLCGIYLNFSANNKIIGNNVTNNFYGIPIQFGESNSIIQNNIATNYNGGMLLFNSSDNSITENTFINDGLILLYSYQNSVVDNIVNGKPLVYLEGVSNYTVTSAGQVVLVKCKSVRVENLNLSAANIGVQLFRTNNTIIIGNNITANNMGGIYLFDSSNNNSIIGNTITNNVEGIFFCESFNNSISGNNITNNNYGIHLGGSSNNSISRNSIINNVYGISLLWDSSNNRVYHNNFLDNKKQVYDFSWDYRETPPSINIWDDGYPSGGNYWSDYTGVDLFGGPYQNMTGGDGIGDTPYIIDANNQDRYPLMAPFSTFEAGVWDGTAYNVDVLSNSTVSDFKFDVDNKSISLKVTGDNGTVGFCRVAIPKSLLWADDGWTIFVDNQPITDYTKFEYENYTYLYFTYTHSTKTVTIKGTHVIPEFPSTIILTIFMLTTTILVVVTKKRRLFMPRH
jgi:parallel beta-helix repeat protein